LLRAVIVELPALGVGFALLLYLYRSEVLTRASVEIWAVVFFGGMAVASTIYAVIGLRRYATARQPDGKR
jgi:hypothetical protein